MLQIKAEILYNRRIKGNYFHSILQAPKIARESLPGQFLMVQESIKHFPIYHSRKPLKVIAEGDFLDIRVNDAYGPLLRRPFSIHRVKGANIELLYEMVGEATEILSQRKPGECLDVIGPLGNGFSYTSHVARRTSHVVLVSGGIGVAPLFFLAEKVTQSQVRSQESGVVVLIGAKTKYQILCEKEFKDLGCEVKIATDDGSGGFKGKVTELLESIFVARHTLHVARQSLKRRGTCYVIPETVIYACGPRPMLEEISRISEQYNIPAQVSLEEHMACGIGACLGCVVNTKEGFKRVCKEGPVFNVDEIIW